MLIKANIIQYQLNSERVSIVTLLAWCGEHLTQSKAFREHFLHNTERISGMFSLALQIADRFTFTEALIYFFS